jgi:hypothetical protein
MAHYAFRQAQAQMIELAKRFPNEDAMRDFAHIWTQYDIAHAEHARAEDTIFFPAMETIFPGACAEASQQHEEDVGASLPLPGPARVRGSLAALSHAVLWWLAPG